MPTCYSSICSYFCSCSVWPVCGVATVALGLCRFACILLLPHAHGLLYLINAAGFFLGVLGASAVVRRIGTLNAIGIAVGACALSLAISTLTTQLTVLGVELTGLAVLR